VWYSWRRLAVVVCATAALVGPPFFAPHAAKRIVIGIEIVAFFTLGFIVLISYYDAASERDQRARQRSDDRTALSNLDNMRNGIDSFFLYLRPFASTGGVRVLRRVGKIKRGNSDYIVKDRVNNPGIHDLYRLEVTWNDLETLLQRRLRRYAPLVGLGRPGEQLGAARVPADEKTWRDLVVDLANNAWLIFLLPSEDPGTKWELDLVMGNSRLLNKTVLIIPGSEDEREWIRSRSKGPYVDSLLAYRKERPEAGARPRPSGDPRRYPEPLRSNKELRRGAIECLVHADAHTAAYEARWSLTGALIMLNPNKSIRMFYSLQGYTTSWLKNPLFTGNVYRLDITALDHALTEVRNKVAAELEKIRESLFEQLRLERWNPLPGTCPLKLESRSLKNGLTLNCQGKLFSSSHHALTIKP
jgi:hypothetical protein